MAQTMLITFEHLGNGKYKWRPYKQEDLGTEHSTVTVYQVGQDQRWLLECDSYYSSTGVLRLEITQHFDRALNTFQALLEADHIQEDLDVERYLKSKRG